MSRCKPGRLAGPPALLHPHCAALLTSAPPPPNRVKTLIRVTKPI